MSEVKIFRIKGRITKKNFQTAFKKEIRALKAEDAVEKLFMELGSKHRLKRFHINILSVEEISLEEVESPIVKKLALGEK
jgi:large subunit ribosomal protein LX